MVQWIAVQKKGCCFTHRPDLHGPTDVFFFAADRMELHPLDLQLTVRQIFVWPSLRPDIPPFPSLRDPATSVANSGYLLSTPLAPTDHPPPARLAAPSFTLYSPDRRSIRDELRFTVPASVPETADPLRAGWALTADIKLRPSSTWIGERAVRGPASDSSRT